MRDDLSINVVGEVNSPTGMGATVDRYIQALQVTGANIRVRNDQDNAAPSTVTKVDLNLICCEIASHFVVQSRLGKEFFRNRYNVGVWLWESPNFPKEWYDRFVYYDELWTPTSFIASALSPISPIP